MNFQKSKKAFWKTRIVILLIISTNVLPLSFGQVIDVKDFLSSTNNLEGNLVSPKATIEQLFNLLGEPSLEEIDIQTFRLLEVQFEIKGKVRLYKITELKEGKFVVIDEIIGMDYHYESPHIVRMEGKITASQYTEIKSDLEKLKKYSDSKKQNKASRSYCLIEEVNKDKETGGLIHSSELILDDNYQFDLNKLREKLEKILIDR